MVRKRQPAIVVAVLVAAWGLATPASAQITTGSVARTVKDPQGGVIPGAPVTLVSETRGTPLPDVFTNAAGDFSFVNVPPDRYTIQVNMTGFKALKKTGVNVSAGDRTVLGVLTIEVGGLSETIQVTSEASLVQTQSGERSFTVSTGRNATINLSSPNDPVTASNLPTTRPAMWSPRGPCRVERGSASRTRIRIRGRFRRRFAFRSDTCSGHPFHPNVQCAMCNVQ